MPAVSSVACHARAARPAGARASVAARRAGSPSGLPGMSSAAAMSSRRAAAAAPPAFFGARPAQLTAGLAIGQRRANNGGGARSVVRMSLFGLGLPELVVIGGVAAVLFGPSKLPELGKSLGKTVKSFQEGANVSRGAFGSRGGFSGDPRRWFFSSRDG